MAFSRAPGPRGALLGQCRAGWLETPWRWSSLSVHTWAVARWQRRGLLKSCGLTAGQDAQGRPEDRRALGAVTCRVPEAGAAALQPHHSQARTALEGKVRAPCPLRGWARCRCLPLALLVLRVRTCQLVLGMALDPSLLPEGRCAPQRESERESERAPPTGNGRATAPAPPSPPGLWHAHICT